MTKDEGKCIVEAIEKIDKRSKSDRLFAYILLIVVTLVVSIVGYNMTNLISSLSTNMQTISSDINSMHNEMVIMSHNIAYIKSMDSSMSVIASDIHSATATHEGIAQDVENLTKNIKKMQKEMDDMNKMNPVRKFF